MATTPTANAPVSAETDAAPLPDESAGSLSHRLNPLFRRAILAATHNRPIRWFVRRYGMRLGAARFISGETLDQAIVQLRALNARGFRTNTTILGEAITDRDAVDRVMTEYRAVLDRIAVEGLRTNLAVKLTQLGLDLGEDLAERNIAELAEYAARTGNFVRIDMEESARVDATLRIFRALRERGHDNTGTVLQSYLYRTPNDLADLEPLHPNLRLVKGAYLEPASVAYPKKEQNDAAYVALAERMLSGDGYTAIATHDDRIIEYLIGFAETHGIARDRFEFQMLYGIRSDLQDDLVRRGFRVLIATPFGTEWYPFFMRRLAERPANVVFFLRSMLPRPRARR